MSIRRNFTMHEQWTWTLFVYFTRYILLFPWTYFWGCGSVIRDGVVEFIVNRGVFRGGAEAPPLDQWNLLFSGGFSGPNGCWAPPPEKKKNLSPSGQMPEYAPDWKPQCLSYNKIFVRWGQSERHGGYFYVQIDLRLNILQQN